MPQLYDTFSRSLKTLVPSDGQRFRFYCCGPTVYGPAHIGNFRTFILQDIFRRMLETAGLNPLHVRNITDVDDKTIARSREEGLSLKAFTEHWTEKFHADCAALNLLPPHHEPRATEHIAEQITMIGELIKRGHAYAQADGSVYFKVDSFADYGQLARLDREHLRTQSTNSGEALNLADEYEREQIADFALWKATKPEDGDNAWDAPWGKGRPGWHIECSAMARRYLGDTLDLHGGGVDLIFPHHENEIAQSRCCTGKHTFAHHWFHCAHLMVEGRKMSKSLGNLYTLAQLSEQGHSPAAVRYALMSGHYRQPLNFTFNSLHAAASAIEKLEKETLKLLEVTGKNRDDWATLSKTPSSPGYFEAQDTPLRPAWQALADDLNIPACLGALFSEIPFDARHADDPERLLTAFAALLFSLGIRLFEASKDIDIPEAIENLARQRWEAKQARNFARADILREELAQAGWLVKDSREGYTIEAIRG